MKKILKYIIAQFSFFTPPPFTHNPEDFKLRWVNYSLKYKSVQYSANGGITWKYIYEAWYLSHSKPRLDKYVFDCEMQSFAEVRKKFPTYQAVLNWDKYQQNEYSKYIIDYNKNQKEYNERIKNNLK